MYCKKILLLLLCILLLIITGACGTTNINEISSENKSTSTGATGKIGKAEHEKNIEENQDIKDKKEELIREEVTFIGQMDPHTIEVNSSKGIFVLQTGKFGDVNWSSIKVNGHLTVEYYENEFGQFVLTNYKLK